MHGTKISGDRVADVGQIELDGIASTNFQAFDADPGKRHLFGIHRPLQSSTGHRWGQCDRYRRGDKNNSLPGFHLGRHQAILWAMRKRQWVDLENLDVLAVDDHSINREFIRVALESTVASLTLASGGHEAIAHAATRQFDLVLMDLHMPDMDGMETWQGLREHNLANGGPRVIALTADSRPEERERLRDAGFHGFLNKPVSVEQLLSAMSRVINGMDAFDPVETERSPRVMLLDDARASRVNGSLARASELRHALADELLSTMPRFHHLMATGQLDQAEQLLHQWAGATGYAGATRLERACRDFEHCLQNDLDSSPGMLYLELVRTIDSTCQAIALQQH